MYKFFSFLLIALVLSLNSDLCLAAVKIKIGVIVPLSGGLANRGEDINKSLPLIADNLNQISSAYSFEFVVEDGKCGAGNAPTTAAQKLINLDHVDFLITGCSGETLQVAPVAERNKIITFAVYSSNPEIKNLGDFIFRTFIDQDTSLSGFSKQMAQRCNNKIAMITEENAFTLSYKKYFQKTVSESLVLAEDLPADTADYLPLLNKSKVKGAECIFLNLMSDSSLSNAVNQAKRLQLNQKLFSNVMAEAPGFRKATGSNSNDLYFIGTPDVESQSEAYNQILREYLSIHPAPNYEFLLRTTYDAARAIADAVIAVGKDSEKIRDYLYSYSQKGALGQVEFDNHGDLKSLGWVLRRMRSDGRHEQVMQLR